MQSAAKNTASRSVQAQRLQIVHWLMDAGFAADAAHREARLLLEIVTGMDTTRQVAMSDSELTDEQMHQLYTMTKRRAASEPMAYLSGKKEFFGLDFFTSRATLIPRPDSEAVVEAALALLPEMSSAHVLDLGTGTGCLLLSVLKHRPRMTGVGVDLQQDALSISARNAMQLDVANRVSWHKGNWFDALPEGSAHFDMILANPPYISSAEMTELMRDVRDYEPHTALHGGADGLDAYRTIITHAAAHLSAGGVIIFEVGHTQAADVAMLGIAAGLKHLATKQDLAGHARVVVLQAEGINFSLSIE